MLFYSKTTIIISAENQDVDLDFNIEVKEAPDEQEVAEKDVIQGSLISWDETEQGEFEVLSTKMVYPELVGQVEIVNNSGNSQTLLKTTQLQASNGMVVRTNRQVVVPASGSVMVDVYPKDPENFSNIDPGNLAIIKLSPSLQSRVYGRNETVLTDAPTEVKALAKGDISRARDELAELILNQVKAKAELDDEVELIYEVLNLETDIKEGVEADKFNLTLTVQVKALDLDKRQLFDLISRKVNNLDLTGLTINQVNLDDENFGDNVLAQVNYTLNAKINAGNSILNTDNLISKGVDEAKKELEDSVLINTAEIYLSPYWRKSLPNKGSKIKIVIK